MHQMIFEEMSMMPHATPLGVAVFRLLAAAVLAGVLGFEREMRKKAAGLRTFITVSVGACLFCLLTFELMELAVLARGDEARTDPIRVIEAVTAGVAFLAAGAILTRGARVEGLTTGAGLWVAGAIGVACGIGQIVLAAVVAALMLVVLVVIRWLEAAGPTKEPRD